MDAALVSGWFSVIPPQRCRGEYLQLGVLYHPDHGFRCFADTSQRAGIDERGRAARVAAP